MRIDTIPWAALASILTAVAIPYLSAAVTRGPSQLTGVLTAAISLLSGFLSQVASQSSFDPKAAFVTALGAWLVASKWHSKVLAGTDTEDRLHSLGGSVHHGDLGEVTFDDPDEADDLRLTPAGRPERTTQRPNPVPRPRGRAAVDHLT